MKYYITIEEKKGKNAVLEITIELLELDTHYNEVHVFFDTIIFNVN